MEKGNTSVTITNSYNAEKTQVEVIKKWSDGENRDQKRPDSIQVQLYAGKDASGEPVTLNSENGWKHTWEELPKNADGNAITYTVKEIGETDNKITFETTGATYDVNYKTTTDGEGNTSVTITNSYNAEKTQVEVIKKWSDGENRDQKRPDSIQVQLYAGKDASGEPVTLNSENGWKHTWEELPKNADGNAITYTVKEIGETDNKITFETTGATYDVNYKTTTDGEGNTSVTITNSYNAEKTQVEVIKKWSDGENRDQKRPDSIQVQLYAGKDASGEPVTLNSENGWKHTWEELPKNADGNAITYTVKEIGETDNKITFETTGATYDVNYKTTTDGEGNTSVTITNSYNAEKTQVEVIKKWSDGENRDQKRPDSIQVQLYAGKDASGEPVTLNSENSWKHTWEELPKNADGNAITYTVKEIGETDNKITFETTGATYDVNYKTTTDGEGNTSVTITNSYNAEKTQVEVIKKWSDGENRDQKRPDSIQVQLYAGKDASGEPVTLNSENSWKHTWEELPKNADGNAITYTVKEIGETDNKITFETTGATYDVNYKTATDEEGNTSVTITNSYTPEKVNIEGSKTWNDGGDTTIRPEFIMINLYADGKLVTSKKVTKADDWKWKFADQPKYEKGVEIEYTITEDKVDGFITTEGTGYDVINTPTTVTVDKVDDGGNPVKDAQLQISIKDEDGNVVDSWIIIKHTITNLFFIFKA